MCECVITVLVEFFALIVSKNNQQLQIVLKKCQQPELKKLILTIKCLKTYSEYYVTTYKKKVRNIPVLMKKVFLILFTHDTKLKCERNKINKSVFSCVVSIYVRLLPIKKYVIFRQYLKQYKTYI